MHGALLLTLQTRLLPSLNLALGLALHFLGQLPKKKAGHKPKSNGCGTGGLTLQTTEETTACCDQHDFCYDTCNTEYKTCESNFRTCLKNVCAQYSTKQDRDGCKQQNQIITMGTGLFGCGAYLESQKNACKCPNDEL